MPVGPIFTIPGILFSELAHCSGYHAEEIPCPQKHLGPVKQRQLVGKVGGGKGQSVVPRAPSRRSHLEQWERGQGRFPGSVSEVSGELAAYRKDS